MNNEMTLIMIENAIRHLYRRPHKDDSDLRAIDTLYEAHKAVGSCGQIPSWEVEDSDHAQR